VQLIRLLLIVQTHVKTLMVAPILEWVLQVHKRIIVIIQFSQIQVHQGHLVHNMHLVNRLVIVGHMTENRILIK